MFTYFLYFDVAVLDGGPDGQQQQRVFTFVVSFIRTQFSLAYLVYGHDRQIAAVSQGKPTQERKCLRPAVGALWGDGRMRASAAVAVQMPSRNSLTTSGQYADKLMRVFLRAPQAGRLRRFWENHCRVIEYWLLKGDVEL